MDKAWVRNGAEITKAIKRTSRMSTNGVTLISEINSPRKRRACLKSLLLIGDELKLDAADDLEREEIERFGEIPDHGAEKVVGDCCRDRGEKSGGGGDEGLRNSRADDRKVHRILLGNALKGVDDADDSSEESDERCNHRDGCQ